MKVVLKNLYALALLGALIALPLRAQPPAGQSFGTAATTPDAVTGGSVSRDYPLGPGDVLELRVFGEPQFDGSYDVDAEGRVTIPFVEQPIEARCRNVAEVRKEVVTALAKFIRSPQVYMRVKEQRSRRAAVVYGAVKLPLRFEMHRRARLLELISNSGGVTEQANGTIQITHTDASICQEPDEIGDPKGGVQGTDVSGLVPYTVYSVADLKLGKSEANPYIRPGDIVYVAEAAPVYVIGAVTSPQGVFLRPGLTLSRAVAMVGGIKKEAKTSEIHIYRQKDGGIESKPLVADFRKIQRNQAPDIMLQPYDVIEVPEKGVSVKDVLIGLVKTSAQSFSQAIPLRPLY